MIIEIKVPTPGESITEVEIAEWLVNDGAVVEKDQELAEIESEKATLFLIAEKAGKVKILKGAHESIPVGDVACTIDTSFEPEQLAEGVTEEIPEVKKMSDKTEKPEPVRDAKTLSEDFGDVKVTPLAKNLMKESGLSLDDVLKGLTKISRKDVQTVIEGLQRGAEVSTERNVHREPMSKLRQKLSERLVAVKNQTAMLTTFNEVDMSEIMRLRKENKQAFVEKFGVKPGMMSFFTRAAAIALKAYPHVNSFIDGNEIVSHDFADIGIAVQTSKGLMVPVVRNADKMNIPELELAIQELAEKARNKKISLEELSGGTFSITNGGVFGSMLSTPILNPPQSAILGMHNIMERPVAINGKVEVRPIMYLALSYDHRIIDGKDSVGFLQMIKKLLESPDRMLFNDGLSADKKLLGL